MRIGDIVHRELPPRPWAEGEKIPWSDAGFGERMLTEHLSQKHDMASRRLEVIEQHVSWIHEACLGGARGRILDLGCGPGLYTQRLALLGHSCAGIDFSPASIAYAQSQAARARLSIDYTCADIRTAQYGGGFDLAMLIFGEFNVFSREDAMLLLRSMHSCLRSGGCLLLEVHSYAIVEQEGKKPPCWSALPSGLFSASPHLLLEEYFWDSDGQNSTSRYFVIDAGTGDVGRYAATCQAYGDGEYEQLLIDGGFADIRSSPSLAGSNGCLQEGMFVLTARKQWTE